MMEHRLALLLQTQALMSKPQKSHKYQETKCDSQNISSAKMTIPWSPESVIMLLYMTKGESADMNKAIPQKEYYPSTL